jgi:hypothetical protein
MEKVVYLLGAGFSTLAGLPLMGNFLEKSKDLYLSEPDRFAKFREVFAVINHMARCKNYFDTDLFNIEDILSVLEMQELLSGNAAERSFIDYICDVVTHTTLADEPRANMADWRQSLFGNHPLAPYRAFVAGLFGYMYFQKEGPTAYRPVQSHVQGNIPRYSIVTLNYDQVLENTSQFLGRTCAHCRAFRVPGGDTTDDLSPWLVKLHGCVSNRDIIPPTWSKGTLSKALKQNWQKALELLTEANHIRIIGYSLPVSDAYVKYLLRAAVIESPHLKRIDVLCLDRDGSAKRRYDEFIVFRNYRFEGRVTAGAYMSGIYLNGPPDYPQTVTLSSLEHAHELVFTPALAAAT